MLQKNTKIYFVHFIFIMILFAMSGVYNYVNGNSINYITTIFMFWILVAAIYVLFKTVLNYFLLIILKNKINFISLYKSFSPSNLCFFTLVYMCIIIFVKEKWLVISLAESLLLIYQGYLLKKKYDVPVKKCIWFVIVYVLVVFIV